MKAKIIIPLGLCDYYIDEHGDMKPLYHEVYPDNFLYIFRGSRCKRCNKFFSLKKLKSALNKLIVKEKKYKQEFLTTTKEKQ